MIYKKDVIIGGTLFLSGYLMCAGINSCSNRGSNDLSVLEKKVIELNERVERLDKEKEKTARLFDFLRDNGSSYVPKTKSKDNNFGKVWDSLSSETKLRIIKEAGPVKVKEYFQGIKEQSEEMYHDLKSFFLKKLRGEK